MNNKKYLIGIVVFSILLSTTIYALNFTNNKTEPINEPLINTTRTTKQTGFSLNTFVYAGAINKTSGERIIVQKRLVLLSTILLV